MIEPLEPKPEQLTPEAKELWWSHLEACERGAERARRELGIKAIIKAQQDGTVWRPKTDV